MGENTWFGYNNNKYIKYIDPYDYRYTFLDNDYNTLINKDYILDYITKIRETRSLPVLYTSLTIDEKRELMDLILNDTELL